MLRGCEKAILWRDGNKERRRQYERKKLPKYIKWTMGRWDRQAVCVAYDRLGFQKILLWAAHHLYDPGIDPYCAGRSTYPIRKEIIYQYGRFVAIKGKPKDRSQFKNGAGNSEGYTTDGEDDTGI